MGQRRRLAYSLLAVLGGVVYGSNPEGAGGGPRVRTVSAAEALDPTPRGKLDLPLRTWVPRRAPAIGQGPMPEGTGKHSRLIFDSKRGLMVLGGGDYMYTEAGHNTTDNYSGMQMVWSIDLSQGERATWTRLKSWCAPAGEIQPGRPDTVVWVYDSTREQGVMMPGFYFITQNGVPTVCPGVTQVNDSVLFNFQTKTWSRAPYGPPPKGYGGDEGGSFGVYDPGTDAVYRFRRMNGNTMEVLYRRENSWEQIPLGVTGQGLGDTNANRDQSAIDVQGRNIYAISWRMRALMRYSIPGKRVVETIPMPPKWVPPDNPGDSETYIVFDAINRVILNPVTRDNDGVLVGLAIYHVDSKKWEWEDPPGPGPKVSGNVLGFDPVNNCLMFLGRNDAHMWWVYRYGDGPRAGRARPLPSVKVSTSTPSEPRPPADPAPTVRLAGGPDNSWLPLNPKPRTLAAMNSQSATAPGLRRRPVVGGAVYRYRDEPWAVGRAAPWPIVKVSTSTVAQPRPSSDPAATARLASMADNTWLPLNPKSRTVSQAAIHSQSATAPDLRRRTVVSGEPVTRSYSGLSYGDGMVFNFGGGHSTHPGNDVDLYFPDANQWVDQYEPESPANGSPEARTIGGAGSSVAKLTPLGRPYTQHTYQQSTYDSRRKRFLVVLPSGTWSWSPVTKDWTLLAGPSKGTFSPDWQLSHGNVVYDPDEDVLLAFVAAPNGPTMRGTYRFNPGSNSWSHVGPFFPSDRDFSYKELYSAYNADRREVAVVVGESRLFRYRHKGNTWTEVTSFPAPLKGVLPNFAYDTKHKVMVFLVTPLVDDEEHKERRTQIWVWDPERDTWSTPPTPAGAPEPILYAAKERACFVYDPIQNIFVFLKTVQQYCGVEGAAECGGTTKTWAYRYQR